MDSFKEALSTSTQTVEVDIGIHHSMLSVLYQEACSPSHMQRPECLNTDDYPRRLDFVRRMHLP